MARAARAANMAVERRTTVPILGCIRIKRSVRETMADFIGTDLDLSVSTFAACQADDEDFDLALPARTLLDLARAFPADALIKLRPQAGNVCIVDADDCRFRIEGLPPKDWPDAIFSPPAHESVLSATFDFATSVRRLLPFMSGEETRYYLCGVGFQGDMLAATNGHILGKILLPPEARGRCVIVPAKACKLIAKLMPEDRPQETIATSTKFVCVSDRVSIATKLIDGTFPDIARVIPKEIEFNGFEAHIPRDRVATALKRATIGFGPGEKTVGFCVGSDGFAQMQSRTAVINLGCRPDRVGDVAFNVRLLGDVIKFLKGDTLHFRASGPDAGRDGPMVALGDGDDLAVIMPMRSTFVDSPKFQEAA
ncbi:hypothetical protein [Terrarubrum flagellatum]|uniref:DNA polymerase III subunit beta n=1 Tax=Terrirubrum flagellatum TaxID=2895980 RepID=UPI0031451A6B